MHYHDGVSWTKSKVQKNNEDQNENENFFRMGTKKSGRTPSGLLFDNR